MKPGRKPSPFCGRGHEIAVVGRYPDGTCRACRLGNDSPPPHQPGTVGGRRAQPTCKWGHALTEDNRYYWRGQFKGCLTCHRSHAVAYRRRRGMKPKATRPVPFGPLDAIISAVGVREFATSAADSLQVRPDSVKRIVRRGRELGFVTVNLADDLCIALGLHPAEVFGPEWWTYGADEDVA